MQLDLIAAAIMLPSCRVQACEVLLLDHLLLLPADLRSHLQQLLSGCIVYCQFGIGRNQSWGPLPDVQWMPQDSITRDYHPPISVSANQPYNGTVYPGP